MSFPQAWFCGQILTVSRAEVGKHASRRSCWVIIKGRVYDLTSFLDSHPGGSSIVLKYAGRDATEAFEPVHPTDTLEKHLAPEYVFGLRHDPRG